MGASLGLVDTTAVAHALGQFNSRIHQGRISDGIFLLDVCVRLHDWIWIVARQRQSSVAHVSRTYLQYRIDQPLIKVNSRLVGALALDRQER